MSIENPMNNPSAPWARLDSAVFSTLLNRGYTTDVCVVLSEITHSGSSAVSLRVLVNRMRDNRSCTSWLSSNR